MKLIDCDNWQPIGVKDLESAAWEVVRSKENTLVMAGPGAGKTELLAQRADYLLRTGQSPAPQRILAISFKKDAAANLRKRVESRCGPLAHRFDSLTFDAFAKQFLDRFRLGIPENWRPSADYEIFYDPKSKQMEAYLNTIKFPKEIDVLNFRAQSSHQLSSLFKTAVYGQPIASNGQRTPLQQAIFMNWWKSALDATEKPSRMTFDMLRRLAQYLLGTNPYILTALRQTYSHLFLDEFQDTTAIHYELTQQIFQNQSTIVTAVGDTKQRIMSWAGALDGIFERFSQDYDAARIELIRNYRSAPELVAIQSRIAALLGEDTASVEAFGEFSTAGSCEVLEFPDANVEAKWIAKTIHDEIGVGKSPREFAILVRQKCAVMSEPVIRELRNLGIQARDESSLQDLLTEPLTEILIALLRLGVSIRDSNSWNVISEFLTWSSTKGEFEKFDEDTETDKLVKNARRHVTKFQCQTLSVSELLDAIVADIGTDFLAATFPQYRKRGYMEDKLGELTNILQEYLDEPSTLEEAIELLQGDNIVPAITIHKSKGLEFDTVIFVGLEDASWWNYKTQSDEERRSFFVAFSRAKQRVIFTFAQQRDAGWGTRRQNKGELNDLYELLDKAGAVFLKFEEPARHAPQPDLW